MGMLEEKAARQRQNGRERRKRHYQRHIGEPKKLRLVPTYLPPEDSDLLDKLIRTHHPHDTLTNFMLRAFRHYAAYLMTPAPVAEALQIVTDESLQIVTDEETPEPVEALQIVTDEETPESEPESIPPPLQQRPPHAVVTKADMIRAISGKPVVLPETPKIKVAGRKEKVAKTLIDADKRVPVRIEFTRKHHHIPWGMRHMMWDNGLQHRGNVWRGRLMPERAEQMAREIADLDGTLEITGGLGDAPKWAPGEYRRIKEASSPGASDPGE